MKITFDYDGASIDVLENDVENNTLVVSPKMENGVFSNYFNFKVDNDSNKSGKIEIKNLNKLLFDSKIVPFIREEEKTFERIDKDKIEYTDEGINIEIDANDNFELSSYPRYVEEDLNKFLKTIKKDFVSVEDGIVKKVIIGDSSKKAIVIIGRQHPGETLSSYFIEGIISELAENHKDYEDNCFVIFPIVSVNGVKNGNHRYTDNTDFNRSWKTKGLVKELDYIKDEISQYDIDCFVDVHCDEVSKIDYIRTKDSNIEDFDDIKVIKDQSKLRRFARALIKQRKIIDLSQMTAREYVSKCYRCDNMLVELSLNKNDKKLSTKKGKDFIKNFEER